MVENCIEQTKARHVSPSGKVRQIKNSFHGFNTSSNAMVLSKYEAYCPNLDCFQWVNEDVIFFSNGEAYTSLVPTNITYKSSLSWGREINFLFNAPPNAVSFASNVVYKNIQSRFDVMWGPKYLQQQTDRRQALFNIHLMRMLVLWRHYLIDLYLSVLSFTCYL